MSALSASSAARRLLRGRAAREYEEQQEHAREVCGVAELSKAERDAMIAVYDSTLTARLGMLDTLVVHPMSNDEIRRGLQVKSSELTTQISTEPGINDPRFGVSDFTDKCPVCNNISMYCPGHMGYIQLPLPIPHPVYVNSLIDLLNSICLSCHRPYITRENITSFQHLKKYSGLRRLKEHAELASRTRMCMKNNCRAVAIKWKFDKVSATVVLDEKSTRGGVKTFTLNEIYDALASISNEDAEDLGFSSSMNLSRPENFILKAIPVIPTTQRPTIRMGREYTNDPITMGYKVIAKSVIEWQSWSYRHDLNNQNVRNKYRDVYQRFEKLIKEKKTSGGPHAGDLHGSVVGRLNGKEGLIRLHTSAKRADQNARTVAGPGPNVRLGQIMVPRVFARKLTVPEVLRTDDELARARRLYRHQRINRLQRGIHTITINDNNRDNYQPELGDVIHRQLMDGDYVVMNRQPTLTMYSIMGYEAVIYDGLTLRIPLPSTVPHNADFDGDDINIQVPQDPKAMQEARCEMSFVQNLLSGHTASLITGAVMNAKTGLYILTGDEVWIDADDFMDYNMSLVHPRNIIEFVDRLLEVITRHGLPLTDFFRLPGHDAGGVDGETAIEAVITPDQVRHQVFRQGQVHGRVVFSLLLPDTLTYRHKVLIDRGVLLRGQASSGIIGSASNSIGHVIALNYGVELAAEFITDATKVGEGFIYRYGFSVGAADCFVSDERIDREATRIIDGVRQFVSSAYDRDVSTEFERLERKAQIQARSNVIPEMGEAILPYIPRENALRVMQEAGAKGSANNVIQVVEAVGQQYEEGSIPEPTLTGGRRSCPTRSIYDHTAEAQGFCVHSFGEGLSLEEEFTHAKSTRDSLMGTAVHTSLIGYLKRRLEQSIRNAIVDDSHAMDSFGFVLQPVAGNDMFDPKYLVRVELDGDQFYSPVDVGQLAAILNNEPGEPKESSD